MFSVVLVCPRFYSKNVFRLDFFFFKIDFVFIPFYNIFWADLVCPGAVFICDYGLQSFWTQCSCMVFSLVFSMTFSPFTASRFTYRTSWLFSPRVVFYLPEAVVLVIYIAWSNIPVSVFFFPSWQHDYNDHLSQGVGAKSLSSLSSSALENFPLSSVCPPILSHQF